MVIVLLVRIDPPDLGQEMLPVLSHRVGVVSIQGVSASIGDHRMVFEPLLRGVEFLAYSLSMNSAGFGAEVEGLSSS